MSTEGNIKFYKIKNEVRIIGIDDAPFDLFKDKRVMLVGAIFRGGQWLDGVTRTEIDVDGSDATSRIIEMVNRSRHKDLRVIMLDGLTFGGFNVVDIKRLFEETKLGVVVIVRQMPDFDAIKEALERFDDFDTRWSYIRNAGKPYKVETKDRKSIYIQVYGIDLEDAKDIVKLSATRSLIPEPVRVAHLIGSGIVLGDSRGGA